MSFKYNKNWQERDRLIFGNVLEKYDTRRFEDLKASILQQLVTQNFANLEDEHNCAPQIQEFLDLAQEWEECDRAIQVTFGGYVVSPQREDYQVSIDSVLINTMQLDDEYKPDIMSPLLIKLIEFAGDFHPDETIAKSDRIYFWWD